jgi:hypothetical protein
VIRTLSIVTCLAALLVVPGSALAARPATTEELAAVSAVYGTAPECSRVVVSQRGAGYARWDFVYNDGCDPQGNGFGIAGQGDDGSWTDLYQASEPSDPCPLTGLPTEIGVELRACSRPSRNIFITNYASGRRTFKPRQLPNGAHSGVISMRWRGWNRSVASGHGTFTYSDAYETSKAPVRVRAWRIHYCGAARYYTRFSVRFVRGADRRHYGRYFEQTMRLGCPE